MAGSIEAVYLVEASPALREAQHKLLCGSAPMIEAPIGFQSTSKYANIPIIWTENIRFVPSGKLSLNYLILTFANVSDQNKSPFIVAHEFFDALPIHAFKSVAVSDSSKDTIKTPTGEHSLASSSTKSKGPQWREMVVSPSPNTDVFITTPESQNASTPAPEFQRR